MQTPMPATPTGSTPGDAPYIRAGGGIEIELSRLVRVAIGLCVLLLVGIVVDLTISAANYNSRQTKLRQQGVPVELTVTGCLGNGSGSGQTVQGYICRGTYTVGGHRYNEVIGGTTVVHPVGQRLQGVAVPSHPSLVSTADGVAAKRSSWTPYITPAILGVVAVALALAFFLWPTWRRPPGSRRATDVASDDQVKETRLDEQPAGLKCPSCAGDLYEGTLRGDSFYSAPEARVPAPNGRGRRSGGAKSRRALRCPDCSTVVVPGDNFARRSDST
jgi:hypothetical protein